MAVKIFMRPPQTLDEITISHVQSGRNRGLSRLQARLAASRYRPPTFPRKGWRSEEPKAGRPPQFRPAPRQNLPKQRRCNADYNHRGTENEVRLATPGKEPRCRVP